MSDLGSKTAQDLEIARQLARDGIPVFTAPPSEDPKDTSGFRLPRNWQETRPDPAMLDAWQPGWAVCMVTGRGLDLVDLDIYVNAEAGNLLRSDGLIPAGYGAAATASGGVHIFVRSIGVASKNNLIPGVDVKSGTADGKGRGFAFIAPTVKKSKVTGQLASYSWVAVPDAARAIAAAGDTSGQLLADLITRERGRKTAGNNGGSPAPPVTPTLSAFAAQTASRPWGNYDPATRKGDKAIRDTLAAGRNDGVMRLACSLRQQGGWSLEAALKYMYEHVWPLIDQGQGGHEFPAQEFEGIIEHAWRAYPDGAEENLRQAEQNKAAARNAAVLRPPSSIGLTDSHLVKQVADWVLNSPWTGQPRLRWARGLGWLLWTGLVWLPVDDSYVRNQVREFFAYWYAESVRIINKESLDATILGKMAGLLSRARIQSVTDLAHGYHDDANPGSTVCIQHGLLTLRCALCSVILDPAAFDAHPDLLNTPGGVVDLRTGEVRPHDSALLLTRITSGSYEKDFRHADWDKALEALPETEREWFRLRIGQGITGHPPGDGIMIVLQGSGENGKTACTTDGPVRALGDYASMASHKLISAATGNRGEHSTEIADLRGKRLLIGEELAEGRSIDVTALKRIQDVGKITARYVHRDNITFDASHTLLVTTNYEPVISETDHGTWRRLALLRFPYTFRRSQEQCIREADRIADPALKQRIKRNAGRQHDAIVTWAVEGAIAWYRNGYADAPPTSQVQADTREWRTQSDLILGFWDEKLEADHSACIQSDEMREQFLAWQTGNGHNPWAKETFGQRFAMHEETTRHGVERRRVQAPGGLVRWPVPGMISRVFSEKQQLTVWLGVRPKVQAETGSGSFVAGLAQQDVKLPRSSSHRSFTEDSASPATTSLGPPRVAEVAEAPGSPAGTPGEAPAVTPPEPGSPLEPESQPVTKTARQKKPKAPARPKPDPALEGPVHPLPVIVARVPDGPPVVVSCTLEQAVQLASAFLGALHVDCETTGYPPGHPDYALRLVQLGGERVAVVLDPDDPAQAAVIRDLVARARALHAHSAAADLVPLAHAGLGDAGALWAKMTDSVLIAKLADPSQAESDENGLKKLAAALLGEYAVSPAAEKARAELFRSGKWLTETTALTQREKSGWAMVRKDCETFARYAGSDVLDLAGVLRVLPAPDPAVLDRERRFQAMCARISHQGFRLDPDHIRAKIAEYEAAQEAAQQRVHAACPAITNPSSTKEVPEALAALGVPLERTKPSARFPQGQLSASKEVLEPLANIPGYEHAPLLRDILEFRHDVTTLGLLLRPLDVLCQQGDGRMRPVVYTIEADTGRTSCRRPNGQQFSRQGGIRACVIADPGMAGISADFAGVEIRVGAALAGDRALLAAEMSTLCQACGNDPCDMQACGKDQKGLHWMAARMAFGPDATKEDRYNSKRIIFSKMFGGGPDTGAKQVGLPVQSGRAVHDAFERIAPRFTAWDQEMRAWVKSGNRGFPAYSGRTIWLPPKHRPHAAGNYAIQGTARELLVDGCLRWEQTRWGHLPLLPIHDEIFTWVPEADAAEASQVLRACMMNQRFYDIYGVPIEAAVSEPFTAWPDSS